MISLCGLIGLAAIGYYLYSTGVIDKRTFLNIGTGEINIINTTESSLSARLTRLDTETGEPAEVNSVDLGSYEIGGLAYIDAGRYRLDIEGTPVEGSCTMMIGGGDLFRVVAVPEGIAIIEEGGNQANAEELNMATSSLCRQ